MTKAKKIKGKMPLTTKILFYMVVSAALGIFINAGLVATDADGQMLMVDGKMVMKEGWQWVQTYFVDGVFYAGGKMFIKGLKMLVVPMVFLSLICGIIGMDDMGTLGRIGAKGFALFMMTTSIAIGFAIFLATTFGIGEGFEGTLAAAGDFSANKAPGFADVVINFVPSNIFGAMAEGEMLQVIVASILVGLAISQAGTHGKAIGKFVGDANEVIMKLVTIIMHMAPYGVACLMAKTFAEQGIQLILPMAGYFFTVVAALFLHYIGTFSGLFMLARLNPLTFLKKMRSVIVFAFSTASSNATIPVTLRAVEERMGVHNSIASFVVPLGATVNMNGTAIMQGVATVFIASVYNHDLTFVDYLTVIGMSVVASIGTAGVPGVGLIMLAMVFTQVGLPVEGIALIIGVDRLLDMMRTAVNVTGDAAVTCVVAKTEGMLDLKKYNDPDAGVIVD